MKPILGSFPFCNAPTITSAQQLVGTYPVGFFWDQLVDAYLNQKTFSFTINAVPDATDVLLDVATAGSVLNTAGLAGEGIALDPIQQSAANRLAVSGSTHSEGDGSCRGFKRVFNQNLCYLEIDFGDVVKQQIGTKQSIKDYLYFPRISLLFYASGYVFSNDVRFLLGAGTIIGGLDWMGSSGVITNIYVVGGSGPPVGTPAVFGQIRFSERYDDLIVSAGDDTHLVPPFPDGIDYTNRLNISGLNFDDITENPQWTSTFKGTVAFGSSALIVVVDATRTHAKLYFPVGLTGCEPLLFRTGRGDIYTTRFPIRL